MTDESMITTKMPATSATTDRLMRQAEELKGWKGRHQCSDEFLLNALIHLSTRIDALESLLSTLDKSPEEKKEVKP